MTQPYAKKLGALLVNNNKIKCKSICDLGKTMVIAHLPDNLIESRIYQVC